MTADPYTDPRTGILHNNLGINAIHPAREGNGRALRAFLGQLADDARRPIAWSRMDPELNIIASQAGHRGDLAPLIRMFDMLVGPPG